MAAHHDPLAETDDDHAAGAGSPRLAVSRPEALCEETREELAELLAAEQMKRNCSSPTQADLRDYLSRFPAGQFADAANEALGR